MNNTHYVVLNEDSRPVFAVKKDKKVITRIMEGISEETGEGKPDSLTPFDLEDISIDGAQFEAVINDTEYTYYIFPLWIY